MRKRAVVALLCLLSVDGAAQEREPYVEHQGEPERRHSSSTDDPLNAFEFAISGDGLWGAYRNSFHRGSGYSTLGLLASKDDDFALYGRLMRFGEPSSETPIGLGAGLGLFGAAIDQPDSKVFAITLTGAVDYTLDIAYPTRVGFELSYAPDIATFSDGEQVLDLLGRIELDLSSWATAFVGYRHLQVDLGERGDHELDSSMQGGVRLGF